MKNGVSNKKPDSQIPYISHEDAESHAPAFLFLPAWLPPELELSPDVGFVDYEEDGVSRRVLIWSYQRAETWKLAYSIVTNIQDDHQDFYVRSLQKWGYQLENVEVAAHKGFLAIRDEPGLSDRQSEMRLFWYVQGHSFQLRTRPGLLAVDELLRIASSIGACR
jgi:hypothetical protein